MDSVATLQKVIDETTRLVNNVRDDQLGDQTLCTDWKVRDLINHLTGGATLFATSAEQGDVSNELMGQLMGGDNLGDDFRGAWNNAAKKAMAAFGEPGVLDKMVTLPIGRMTAGDALNIAIFDVTTHACDLAKATGQTVEDRSILETALELGPHIVRDEYRQPGVFGPAQAAADDSDPADKLLAFAGRSV